MILSSLIGTTAAAATLPGTAELLMLTLGGVLPPKHPKSGTTRKLRKLAVVVPAHDEQEGIAGCVKSLLAADSPNAELMIVVIADNCTDDVTATRAREAGATVWEREDKVERGKGYALDFAFQRLMQDEEVDAVLIVDADTDVDANFLVACESAFNAGADAVQVPYFVKNAGDSQRTRLMNVAFMAFNVLRPRGRERLGLSVGILGNGWGMSRACLEAVPYDAKSVVEDLEHHINLVKEGFRVHFIHDSAVRADMPAGEAGSDTQRARWEGGRFRMIKEQAPKLLWQALQKRDLKSVEPALELMLMPLAYHVAGLGVALVVPFPPTQLYALFGLGVVGAHVASGLAVGNATKEDLKALLGVPKYVLWKANILPKILKTSSGEAAWVRTAREGEAATADAG